MHNLSTAGMKQRIAAAALAVAVVIGFLTEITAASSWSPTLLVNTESFETIDQGDGTTNIELRFGDGTKTLKFLTTSEFQFSHSISVLGNMSGTSLHVDKDATFGAGVTASGTIRGVGNIRAQGTLSGNALNVNRNGTFGGTLTATGTITGGGLITAGGNVRAAGTLSGNALNVNRNGTFGGTLTVTGAITTKASLSGATFYGAGLGDCSNTNTQKLVYDKATGRFTCATDQTGAGSNGSGQIMSFHPQYPNAIYFSSGSTNIGQLTQSGSNSSTETSYLWNTTRATIQDYWIATRVRLPDNFSSWDPVQPIELRYRTTDGTASNNHVTVRMKDTSGANVTLTNNAGLASATFTTARINISGGTFAAKGYVTIYIKLAALTAKNTEVSFLNLNFENTLP